MNTSGFLTELYVIEVLSESKVWASAKVACCSYTRMSPGAESCRGTNWGRGQVCILCSSKDETPKGVSLELT